LLIIIITIIIIIVVVINVIDRSILSNQLSSPFLLLPVSVPGFISLAAQSRREIIALVLWAAGEIKPWLS